MTRWAAAGAVAVMAGTVAACGSTSKPIQIDERTGVVGSVRLGESRGAVVAALGRPGETRNGGPYAPLDEEFVDIGGPESVSLPRATRTHEVLRYHHLAVLLADGRVYSMLVSGRARTRRGPAVGDSLSVVRRAFPGSECHDVAFGEEGDTYPSCVAHLAAGVIAFGRDPVRSITLTARPSR